MTLEQFDMHRPRLARSLREFVSGECAVLDVAPCYDDGVLFRATVSLNGHVADDMVAVCVNPTHPAAMYEENTPGEPTWWWEEDLKVL